MPKYLIQATYTPEGTRGLLRDGGTGRRAAVAQALEGIGGKLESFNFAFGADDVFAIVDVPDQTAVAALSLGIAATGTVNIRTTVLITPEEMDKATRTKVNFRKPGG